MKVLKLVFIIKEKLLLRRDEKMPSSKIISRASLSCILHQPLFPSVHPSFIFSPEAEGVFFTIQVSVNLPLQYRYTETYLYNIGIHKPTLQYLPIQYRYTYTYIQNIGIGILTQTYLPIPTCTCQFLFRYKCVYLNGLYTYTYQVIASLVMRLDVYNNYRLDVYKSTLQLLCLRTVHHL